MRNTVTARAIAFARTAANAAATDAERATATDKLTAHCAKHNLNIADIIAQAAKADPVVRAPRKPAADNAAYADAMRKTASATKQKPENNAKREAPKAEKPAKPADAAKAAAAAEREALINEMRANVSAFYNGPSLAVRTNPKRYATSVYSALLATPKHRTTLDRISARDESALALIIKRGTKTGGFDPVALNLDSGIFSRLASVGFIIADADGFTLSADALTHARKAAKRAA